jgi:hypothetical protein
VLALVLLLVTVSAVSENAKPVQPSARRKHVHTYRSLGRTISIWIQRATPASQVSGLKGVAETWNVFRYVAKSTITYHLHAFQMKKPSARAST